MQHAGGEDADLHMHSADRPGGLVGIHVIFWQPGHGLDSWREYNFLTFVPGSGEGLITEQLLEETKFDFVDEG